MEEVGQEEVTITAHRGRSIDLRELWLYRELFYFFTWRDVKVKYKQTVIGVFWAVLQPLLMMILFTFIFGRSQSMESLTIPYPLYAFSGLLLWNLFSTGISNAGSSMITNSNIIKKIYFPRLIIPLSAILSSLIDFCFAFVILLAMLLWFQIPVHIGEALLFWPLGLLLGCLATLGPGCWLAALNVKYRDFRYIIPFLIQALLFLTPVIYPISTVQNEWVRRFLAVNPMFAAVEIFRLPIVGMQGDQALIIISICSNVVLGLVGITYFKRTEMYFADLA